MTATTSRLRPWLAFACLLAFAGQNLAQTNPADIPPQHRTTRSDPSDTTPMTVVASADTFYGQGWYWVPIDGAKCRHNTDTGIAVRLRSWSDKIVITLQGGGACYNSATCAANVSDFGLADFQAVTASPGTIKGKWFEGIWKISAPFHVGTAPTPNLDFPNRLADEYTQVVIPYCSGDMHVGARQNANIPWVAGTQNFQGAKNTDLYYRYIVEQLLPRVLQPQVEVVLSGYSAGGYGATFTAARLRDMLPANASMVLMTDSAPPFDQTTSTTIPANYISQHGTLGSPSHTLLRPCMLQRLHDTWGLANTVVKDCGTACNAGNWMNPVFDKLLRERPDVFVAMTSSTYDATMRAFMSTLVDANCAWDPTEAQYTEGLLKLRAQMQASRSGRGNVATYFISTDKTSHVAFTSQRYFDLTQATAAIPAQPTVRLQDWTQEMIYRPVSGPPLVPTQVGP